jgi:hypothetical protein
VNFTAWTTPVDFDRVVQSVPEAAGSVGVVEVMDTGTERDVTPPAPVHCRVKVAAALSAALSSLPDVPLFPAHDPDAAQLVAFVDDQVSVVCPPAVTEVGLAVRLIVGGGVVLVLVRDTAAVRVVVPPAPVHASVNVVAAVSDAML